MQISRTSRRPRTKRGPGRAAFLAALLGVLLGTVGCLSSRTDRTLRSAESSMRQRLARAGHPPAEDPDDESSTEGDDPAAEAEAEERERAELLAAAAAPDLPAPSDEAALADSLDLADVEALVLAHNPSLRETALRVKAMTSEARARGSLPPPTFMTELQGVPFERPYRVDQASMAMIGLRQTFPAPGALDAMADATGIEAQAEAAMLGVRARALLREADRAFADYAEASELHRAHVAHVAAFEQMASAARARYAAGGMLADVTRAELEGLMLEQHIAHEHGDIQLGALRLNTLMGRHASAPLGRPRWHAPVTVAATGPELVALALRQSPELAAAELKARAAERMAESADIEATVPELMAGVSVFLPVNGMPTGWGANFGMSLPWFWNGAPDRAEGYRTAAQAERAAGDAMRLRVEGEVETALAAVHATASRLSLLIDRARPASLRAVDAAGAGYASGGTNVLMWLDAVRAELDVVVEVSMVRAELERALADLDWTVGSHVPRVPLASGAQGHEEIHHD